MEEFRSRSFRMEGSKPQPRSGIRRSSSHEPLLESAPSSHCMAAASLGEEELLPAVEKAESMASRQEKKVVMVGNEQRPSSPAVGAKGYGGQRRGAPWSYVGWLFSNKVNSVGVAIKEGETSSPEVAEQEREGKKGKQKKRWSWMPDPEKRWPVQGW